MFNGFTTNKRNECLMECMITKVPETLSFSSRRYRALLERKDNTQLQTMSDEIKEERANIKRKQQETKVFFPPFPFGFYDPILIFL